MARKLKPKDRATYKISRNGLTWVSDLCHLRRDNMHDLDALEPLLALGVGESTFLTDAQGCVVGFERLD